jgi:hypothetical protein
LNESGNKIKAGSSPERVELPNDIIKFLGGGTNAEQERDLEEDEY